MNDGIIKCLVMLIYIYYVDIFIIVFYLLYYCNIRYVVLSFDEIKTCYYYYRDRNVVLIKK